jgi:GTP-binding protein Era
MVIGKGAQMLKKIGTDVRRELESVTGDKIFLQLQVDVDPKWPQRFADAQ